MEKKKKKVHKIKMPKMPGLALGLLLILEFDMIALQNFISKIAAKPLDSRRL